MGTVISRVSWDLLNTYIIRKGIRKKGKGFKEKMIKTLENEFDDLI